MKDFHKRMPVFKVLICIEYDRIELGDQLGILQHMFHSIRIEVKHLFQQEVHY
jgi:hypothetical protein